MTGPKVGIGTGLPKRPGTSVTERFNRQVAWDGDVEVFNLIGHPKAKRAYGWSYGEPEQFITIQELPAVGSADDAVKVGVAYQIKKGKL
jgi:hypothetical protein